MLELAQDSACDDCGGGGFCVRTELIYCNALFAWISFFLTILQ